MNMDKYMVNMINAKMYTSDCYTFSINNLDHPDINSPKLLMA